MTASADALLSSQTDVCFNKISHFVKFDGILVDDVGILNLDWTQKQEPPV